MKFYLLAFLLITGCSYRNLIPRQDVLKGSEGYVLIVPMDRPDKDVDIERKVSLIDSAGNSVKDWKINFLPFYGSLGVNGELYISGEDRVVIKKVANGMNSLFRIYDKNKKLIWEYRNPNKHHDFKVLPNGNISFIQYYQLKPEEIGLKRKASYFQGYIWADEIVEINPKTDEIEWSWKSHEFIDFKKISRIDKRGDILHTNSIDFIERFHITGKPAYMISSRSNSTVYIIDKETKKIIWESPQKMFLYQHDASFLDNKNILVFDNRKIMSRVVEVDIEKNHVVWSYVGGEHFFQSLQFNSAYMSGVQRLSNGNTLISLGISGYVFEINQNSEVVWNYFNTVRTNSPKASWPYSSIFKAKKYYSY